MAAASQNGGSGKRKSKKTLTAAWRSTGRKTPDGKTLYACPTHPRELRVRKMRNVRANDGTVSKRAIYIAPSRVVPKRRSRVTGGSDVEGVDYAEKLGISHHLWPKRRGGQIIIIQKNQQKPDDNIALFKKGLGKYIKDVYNPSVAKNNFPTAESINTDFFDIVDKIGNFQGNDYFVNHEAHDLSFYSECAVRYLMTGTEYLSNGLKWRQLQVKTGGFFSIGESTQTLNVIVLSYVFTDSLLVTFTPTQNDDETLSELKQAVNVSYVRSLNMYDTVEDVKAYQNAINAKRLPPPVKERRHPLIGSRW